MAFDPTSGFHFPEYAVRASVQEDAFAAAYATVTDSQRGLLKKSIAQLLAWYGRSEDREIRKIVRHESGLASATMSRPLDWTILAVDETLASPAQFLAVLLVPLLAGVRQVLAVRTAQDSPWPPALLTSAELAGVETLLSSQDNGLLPNLVNDLSGSQPRGMVVALGQTPLSVATCAAVRDKEIAQAALKPVQRIGVWHEGGLAWDEEALGFAHPGTQLVHCREVAASGAGTGKAVSWAEFLAMGFDAVLVPEHRLEAALGRVSLVLGPGQECFWAWPSLGPDSFRDRSAGFWEEQDERNRAC